jgi:hypothetical protein
MNLKILKHILINNLKEWKNEFDKFQEHPLEEENCLRFLFLQHLSLQHNIHQEKKDFDYEPESAIDDIFQNEFQDFETFFD